MLIPSHHKILVIAFTGILDLLCASKHHSHNHKPRHIRRGKAKHCIYASTVHTDTRNPLAIPSHASLQQPPFPSMLPKLESQANNKDKKSNCCKQATKGGLPLIIICTNDLVSSGLVHKQKTMPDMSY